MAGTGAGLRAAELRTDQVDRPRGVESSPTLSWRVESEERGAVQSAYRIRVATERETLRDTSGSGEIVWDSGRVESDETTGIRYEGPDLAPRATYWWTVTVWDGSGAESAPAEPTWWETGLRAGDWEADWLEAEDPAFADDARHGLTWVWGGGDDRAGVRRFRQRVRIPRDTTGGRIVAGADGRRVTIEVDGVRLAETREDNEVGVIGTRPFAEGALPPLPAGDHEFVVDVGPAPEMEKVAGMAAFARMTLDDGDVLRLGTEAGWEVESGTVPGSWSPAGPSELTAQSWPPEPARRFRRDLELPAGTTRARLYITALGAYEARINGERVGDDRLQSEPSQYERRAMYRVHDVTALLRPGRNAIGLTVGDGWYASTLAMRPRRPWEGSRRVLAQLEVTGPDGTRTIVATGAGWRTASSPILRAEIYDGERFDTRLDETGWDRPGFDDASWTDAVVGERPDIILTAQTSSPIREIEARGPVETTHPAPGVAVVDFGQNLVGWCRLRVRGERGATVRMRFAETLLPAGGIDRSNLRQAAQEDAFTLAGTGGVEEFEPHFTYHGFRYAEIADATGSASPGWTLEGIEAAVLTNDTPEIGRIETSEPLVDRLFDAIRWTQRSNFVGYPLDCPQRDERLGYFGDGGIFWETASFLVDTAAFSRRFLQAGVDAVGDGWAFPPSLPSFDDAQTAIPGWADGAVIIAWVVWRSYGDTAVIRDNWPALVRYVAAIEERNPGYLWRYGCQHLGDWLAVDERRIADPTTDHEMFATAYWAHSARLLAEMADAIGETAEAERLRALRSRIERAFAEAYVADSGTIANGSQCAQAMALRFGLVPESLRERAGEVLAAEVRGRGTAISTGIVGTQFVLDALADTGHADVAIDLLLRREFPSWGYMLGQGATTLWESWDRKVWSGMDGGSGKFPNSHNHYALGAVGAFLARRIAGIAPGDVGYRRIVVDPVLDPRITRGGGRFDSVRGLIETAWEQGSDGAFSLTVRIPANTRAEIHLPAPDPSRVTVDGIDSLEGHPQVTVARVRGNLTIVSTGGGSYRFDVAGNG